jgi:hypothetical protein
MFRSTLFAALAALPLAVSAAPLGPAFSYQGFLRDSSQPASGLYDFQVCVYEATTGGAPLNCAPDFNDVPVQGGDFALALNFPASTFLGEERFLEVRARAGTATGAYTVLTPRQLIRSVPEALRANAASTAPWSGLSGVPAGFADGIDNTGVASITAGAGLSGGTVTGTGTIAIANGGITQAMIGPGAVGTAQIADGAVGFTQIAPGAVGAAQINDSQVQRRIGGTCAVGEYFRGINADGTTLCEPVPGVPRVSVVAAGPALTTAQPSVAIGPDGLPVVAYVTNGLGIRVARCANAACTAIASDNLVVATQAANPGLVVRGDGRPLVAYYDINGALRVASCSNAACTGDASIFTVPIAGNVGQFLAITAAPSGRIWIAFYAGGPAGDLYVYGCQNSNCSPPALNALAPVLLDSAGDVGSFVSIAVGADNRPVIAYREASANGRLKVAKCGPPAFVGPVEDNFCTTPSITVVDSLAGRDFGYFTSIAVPADGNPVISYHDGTAGSQQLRFVKCANSACTANTAVRNIDSTVGVGSFSTIAVPSDNLPVIAYIDDPQGALKFAKCRTATCGESAIITTLDDNAGAEDTGWEARMLLGRDGLPLVVYQDLLSRQVRAVKCGSRSCQ